MAGMMLNGLGFAHRPLSLTPQFFASKPLDLVLHDGIRAAMFKRFQLGRTLDEAYAYGCDLLFHELALGVCAQDGIDLRFNHLDTTSFSLTGEYVPDRDEQAMTITHGYSRAHRPDWKQAVLELMVSQDGGIPFVRPRGDGHTSDIEIFQARTQAFLTAFTSAPSPRDLLADSQLYHADNAPHFRHLGFITRLPNTIGAVSEAITQALALESWARLDEATRDQRLELCHDGMAQRWLVVSSQAALERAEARLTKASQREEEAIHKPLLHLQAQRFATPEAAHEALTAWATGWLYHLIDSYDLSDHQR
jgi:transposase